MSTEINFATVEFILERKMKGRVKVSLEEERLTLPKSKVVF